MVNKEDKSQKFKRLAAARGDRVIKELSILGNLANRNNYEYTEAEVAKLFSVIEAELKDCKSKFLVTNAVRRVEF